MTTSNNVVAKRITVQIPTTSGDMIEAWIYLPEGSGPHPTVVMAHGIGGIRRTCQRTARSFRMNVLFIASVGIAVRDPEPSRLDCSSAFWACPSSGSRAVAARKAAASSFKTESECYRYDDVVDARSRVVSKRFRPHPAQRSNRQMSSALAVPVRLTQGEHREELSR